MQNELVDSKKRSVITGLTILLLIPSLILFGVFVLGDRKYYFISILIIICAMFPFFMVFENRKPKARELIVIAVMSTLAVTGRAAFFMIPQFKPVVAIVIITGVSFGGQAGFLTGAITAFVSNFFYGQGAWTPWQMFAFGLIGFLAGVIFQKGLLKKNTINLCVFGGISTLIIYGGLLNLNSVFLYTTQFTLKSVIAIYLSALPFDLVHSISTVVFLLLISKVMIEKLDRVKTKYGIME